jgi:hypothetical protein
VHLRFLGSAFQPIYALFLKKPFGNYLQDRILPGKKGAGNVLGLYFLDRKFRYDAGFDRSGAAHRG